MFEKLKNLGEGAQRGLRGYAGSAQSFVTRRALALSALAAGVTVAMFLLKDITSDDIVAHNAFLQGGQAVPLAAGDIVTVDARGKYDPICQPRLPTTAYLREQRAGMYFNRLDRLFGQTLTGLAAIRVVSTETAEGYAAQARKPFVGMTSALRGGAFTFDDVADCPCKVAQALARGARVCQVSASLVETGQVVLDPSGSISVRPAQQTLAVALNPNAVLRGAAWPENCPKPAEAAVAPTQTTCSAYRPLPFDVRLRNGLNLIARDHLPVELATLE